MTNASNNAKPRKKIDPLFLNRLVQARGYRNFDMRAETMEASFVTKNSGRNSSFAMVSDLNRSLVPENPLLQRPSFHRGTIARPENETVLLNSRSNVLEISGIHVSKLDYTQKPQMNPYIKAETEEELVMSEDSNEDYDSSHA